MTFGAWREILFVRGMCCGRLLQIGDFFVEVGEGGFERFAMLGMGGGSKVIHDAGARQLQIVEPLFARDLFRGFLYDAPFVLGSFRFCHLRFDVLAFPASCHA